MYPLLPLPALLVVYTEILRGLGHSANLPLIPLLPVITTTPLPFPLPLPTIPEQPPTRF
jgi:hypothetical protein